MKVDFKTKDLAVINIEEIDKLDKEESYFMLQDILGKMCSNFCSSVKTKEINTLITSLEECTGSNPQLIIESIHNPESNIGAYIKSIKEGIFDIERLW